MLLLQEALSLGPGVESAFRPVWPSVIAAGCFSARSLAQGRKVLKGKSVPELCRSISTDTLP